MRVVTYIDGFNLYHAIDDLNKPHLKWVNLWSLSESLLRKNERLAGVKYFSAWATHRSQASVTRHQTYVAALEHHGVEAVIGSFKRKPRSCNDCGAQWTSHEEKETDVHIGISMVADAIQGTCERIILISADSDLAPAVRMVKRYCPKLEVFVAAPPGRFGNARDLSPKMVLTQGRLAKHLLPEQILSEEGAVLIQRPAKYAPPHSREEA